MSEIKDLQAAIDVIRSHVGAKQGMNGVVPANALASSIVDALVLVDARLANIEERLSAITGSPGAITEAVEEAERTAQVERRLQTVKTHLNSVI